VQNRGPVVHVIIWILAFMGISERLLGRLFSGLSIVPENSGGNE